MSYVQRNIQLGEFAVPTGEDWMLRIQYTARPPLVVRGALNPWQLERQRVLYTAEEKAWAEIQGLQKQYKSIDVAMRSRIVEFNNSVAELESVTGKKSGIAQISTYGSMVGIIPGFQLLAGIFAALGFLTSFIGGNNKKKKIKQLIERIERLQSELASLQQRLKIVVDKISYQLDVTQRIQSAQQVEVQNAIESNAREVAVRQYSEQAQAQARRTLYERARLTERKRLPYSETGDLL